MVVIGVYAACPILNNESVAEVVPASVSKRGQGRPLAFVFLWRRGFFWLGCWHIL